MPGIYALGDYDLAGSWSVWSTPGSAASRCALVTCSSACPPPPSTPTASRFAARSRGRAARRVYPELGGRRLGEVLLEPHRSYCASCGSCPWKAAGGTSPAAASLATSTARCPMAWRPVRSRLVARCRDLGPGRAPRAGGGAEDEMLGTFNMGLGMVLVTGDPLPGFPVVGARGRAGRRPAREVRVTADARLGVLASGGGTNLRNLVERGYRVVAVATNRPSCGAAAHAREHGLPLGEFSQRRFRLRRGTRRRHAGLAAVSRRRTGGERRLRPHPEPVLHGRLPRPA